MAFHETRRQQFLSEDRYEETTPILADSIAYFDTNPYGSGRDQAERDMLGRMSAAVDRLNLFILKYTAGEPIEPLRAELEEVVAAYERYGEHLWKYTGDRNEVVFTFVTLDEYCQLMQLIGLCFLLHRRDLLPRIAALQDGVDGTSNGGVDTLYEEFMAFGIGPETRFETDHLCQVRPYESLFYALTEKGKTAQLKELGLFLKRWYKDLAGTGWHDAHIEQAGYYGYWSFEAGAALLLLGIEDDSSLHKYLYYPKHLVAWAKENAHRFPNGGLTPATTTRLNVAASQPCPETGWWFTPAQTNSRRFFKEGAIMPALDSDYGATFWQWSPDQSAPTL
jgi:hypothetical protein